MALLMTSRSLDCGASPPCHMRQTVVRCWSSSSAKQSPIMIQVSRPIGVSSHRDGDSSTVLWGGVPWITSGVKHQVYISLVSEGGLMAPEVQYSPRQSVSELPAAGHTAAQLRAAGVPVHAMQDAGVTVTS